MPRFIVTGKAGRYVAGHRNPSEGELLDLTPEQARYELILGTIIPAPEKVVDDLEANSVENAEPTEAARNGKKKR